MIWPRFLADQRGNMAVLFAVGFTLSAFVSALAVDAAALYHERRRLQAAVDLAAISAAADPSRAAEIARSVLSEARLLAPDGTAGLSVVAGRYDPGRPRDARFQPGAVPANAVAVEMQRPGALYFAAPFAAPPVIGARGLAAVTPEVAFSIGSRLASLNGGLVNALLSRLLGTQIALNVMDYRALADARVDALAFLDALAAQMGIGAGTYDELLALNAGPGPIAAALAGLTDGAARTALQAVALAGQGSPVPLRRLFALGGLGKLHLGSAPVTADLLLSPLDLLAASAALANGQRQVSLALGAGIPGLTGLRLDLAIGEVPQGGNWFAVGAAGTVLRTAQTRLRLKAELLGGPLLLGAGVKLSLWLDLAPAEARLVSATCPAPGAPKGSAVIAARPGLAHLALGELGDSAFRQFGALPSLKSAKLVDVLLLRITGAAQVEIAQTTPVTLSFSSADIAGGVGKSATTHTPVASLAGSLLADLDLTIDILGLGLAPAKVIAGALRDLLAPLAPTLDLTIGGALSALGLGIGEADIRVHGVRCGPAVLVG
ncbi:MAG: hypothetical protein ABS76_23290 [Pelagibacterium sp. SCN 64-44]|nr:MAG: hypothetical protein ABS76_23290 [Pelagibacterium sp. SCN 64-44]